MIGNTATATAKAWTALVLIMPLVAVAAVMEPMVLLVPLGLAALYVALRAPVIAAGIFVFCHVALPVYLRVTVPGLHEIPVSTAWMMCLFGLGILAWLGGASLPPRLGPEGRRATVFFALFFIAVTSSLIDPRASSESFKMWGIALVFPSLAFLLVSGTGRTVEDVRVMELFLLLGGVSASVYAIYELASGGNPLLDYFQIETVAGYYTRKMLGDIVYRCFSVYLNPIEFGSVMGMLFPIAAIRVISADTRRERILFGMVTLFIAVGAVLSVSRGPILGLSVGVVLIGIIFKRLRPALLIAGLVAAAGLLAAWPFLGARLHDRVYDADNVTLRLKLFQTAIAIFLDHPLRGIGIGNFANYYLDAIRDHHIGPWPELGGNRVEKIRVAENAYLQLSAETGVVGVAAAVGAVAALMRLCLRLTADADPRISNGAISIMLSTIVYGVNAMTVTAYTLFGPTLLMLGVLPAFAIILDRAAWMGSRQHQPDQREPSAKITTRMV